MSDRREILIQLRGDLNLMRDCVLSGVREAAVRMLALIEAELSAAEPAPQKIEVTGTDPSRMSSELLLREISRRMRQIRHVRKVCFRCKVRPMRARGLCTHCYKKAYRRGEIKKV